MRDVSDHMKLKKQHYNESGGGFADFFPIRHKKKIFDLAQIEPSDVLYDLGCGDGSILIFAVKKFKVKKAFGYETDYTRNFIARKNVEKAGLQNKISIINEDFNEIDLSKADVIFDMLPEYKADLKKYLNKKIKHGTRLIKHDLPLIAYLPDKVDIPFYRMKFPLVMAKNRTQWASKVLEMKNAKVSDVWHDLYYYQYEKTRTKWDIYRFEKILTERLDGSKIDFE
jgi:SAM-dependent methyltransferase